MANDHAIEINDGGHRVTETLAPPGAARVVADATSGAVAEDLPFRLRRRKRLSRVVASHSGRTVDHVRVDAPALSALDVAGAVTYELANAHGDVIGVADAADTFRRVSGHRRVRRRFWLTNRRGWLGAQDRFSLGTDLGVIRMGVRMYAPRLGRFLEVDPVEGGSANDYDYANGDPVNSFDLDGTRSCKWNHPRDCGKAARNGVKRAAKRVRGVITDTDLRGWVVRGMGTMLAAGVTGAACLALPGVGCIVAGSVAGAATGALWEATSNKKHKNLLCSAIKGAAGGAAGNALGGGVKGSGGGRAAKRLVRC